VRLVDEREGGLTCFGSGRCVLSKGNPANMLCSCKSTSKVVLRNPGLGQFS
jgi:hypothetical protein